MTMTNKLSSLALIAVLALGACADETIDPTSPVAGGGGKADGYTARPYFEVFTGSNGDFYFHLAAANHEIILASEGYSTRTGALASVIAVQNNAGYAERYQLAQAVDGQFYFNLRNASGQIIGTSELYTTRSAAERGVEAVDRNVGDYLAWSASRSGARFAVSETSDGRYYFVLHAGNGEIVLVSEAYNSEAAALNGTFSVVDNGRDADAYAVSESNDGGYYFNLLASNGQVIATSEVYASKWNAERARDSVVTLLPSVDLL
jgi:uncharacterized protein YegP (UPF0339 family)